MDAVLRVVVQTVAVPFASLELARIMRALSPALVEIVVVVAPVNLTPITVVFHSEPSSFIFPDCSLKHLDFIPLIPFPLHLKNSHLTLKTAQLPNFLVAPHNIHFFTLSSELF